MRTNGYAAAGRPLLAAAFAALLFCACATGEEKREGTDDRPQPSVGTTFDEDNVRTAPNTTGTAPPGDTAGANAREGVNDQTGPTGRGPEEDHPEAPAY